MLVAPVLVFVGYIMGQDMDLIFSPLELVAIVLAVYVDAEPDLRRRVELARRLDPDRPSTSCSASRSCTTPGPIRPTRWPFPRPPWPGRDRVGRHRRTRAAIRGLSHGRTPMLGVAGIHIGLLIWLVRDLGRVRHHRPAAHRGADEAAVGPVQPVELAALGRGGAEDRAAGPSA